jgi:hypothetical protein
MNTPTHVQSSKPRQFGAIGLLVFAVFLSMWIGGCAPPIQYVYTPPTTPEGRNCITQCLNNQQQCRFFKQSQYQECQNRYNYEMQMYNNCRSHAHDKHEQRNCLYPPACYSPSNYDCDEQFRSCYQICGGQVQAIMPQPAR